MSWASCLCVNACNKVCRSNSVTRNDRQKAKTKVYLIVMLYNLGLKPILIEQKWYKTPMWHLNKVEGTNFVDGNEILVEKYYC